MELVFKYEERQVRVQLTPDLTDNLMWAIGEPPEGRFSYYYDLAPLEEIQVWPGGDIMWTNGHQVAWLKDGQLKKVAAAAHEKLETLACRPTPRLFLYDTDKKKTVAMGSEIVRFLAGRGGHEDN